MFNILELWNILRLASPGTGMSTGATTHRRPSCREIRCKCHNLILVLLFLTAPPEDRQWLHSTSKSGDIVSMVAGIMYALVIVMAMAILPPPHYPSYTHPRHHHHRGVAAPGARLYYTHLINIHTHTEEFFLSPASRELSTTLAILFSSL